MNPSSLLEGGREGAGEGRDGGSEGGRERERLKQGGRGRKWKLHILATHHVGSFNAQ